MTITPTLVMKPWGYELWIADGVRTPYANKKILFRAGCKSSLQVHKEKVETNYVLSGYGTLLISERFFDVDLYLNGKISAVEVEDYIKEMTAVLLSPGVAFDVSPGHLHRVIATTDLEFLETSTCQLDDVVRLLDDTNRAHGRIDAEHR
jgi:mannose-1-phosphate guanylyltransferase